MLQLTSVEDISCLKRDQSFEFVRINCGKRYLDKFKILFNNKNTKICYTSSINNLLGSNMQNYNRTLNNFGLGYTQFDIADHNVYYLENNSLPIWLEELCFS